MAHRADIELLNKLADEADNERALKRQQEDKEGVEYFRGVAAGLRCAAELIKESGG